MLAPGWTWAPARPETQTHVDRTRHAVPPLPPCLPAYETKGLDTVVLSGYSKLDNKSVKGT